MRLERTQKWRQRLQRTTNSESVCFESRTMLFDHIRLHIGAVWPTRIMHEAAWLLLHGGTLFGTT
jgi:hypothetical protein